jgi:thiol:disulfide interchange protein DsbA
LVATLILGLWLSIGGGLFLTPALAAGPSDSPSEAAAEKPKDKAPYQAVKPIDKPQRFDPKDGEVELLYFFWYGCPTCKMIDDEISAMGDRLPEGVRFRKLPAAFLENPEWMTHATLFWALESLGLEKGLHKAVFQAVQPGEEPSHGPLQLLSKEAQKSFAKANKLDAKAFSQALDSAFVSDQVQKTRAYVDGIELGAVPSFVVNGKFIVTIQSRRPIEDFAQEAERLALAELAAAKAAPAKPIAPAK